MRIELQTNPGTPGVDGLLSAVDDGSIDTVILALTDHYGRLLGKPLDTSFFCCRRSGRNPRLRLPSDRGYGIGAGHRALIFQLGPLIRGQALGVGSRYAPQAVLA